MNFLLTTGIAGNRNVSRLLEGFGMVLAEREPRLFNAREDKYFLSNRQKRLSCILLCREVCRVFF
jgi:hypothetical protein